MSNLASLIVNSVVYLAVLALMVFGMYLQVIPQSVGLVIISAVLTHAGLNLPSGTPPSAPVSGGGGVPHANQ